MSLNRKPIPVNDAVALVLENITLMDTETVSYLDAHDRILANDLVATHDVPLFTKSAMDGFAIRARDSEGASGDNRIPFKVVEEVPAGSTSDYELQPNEAFRIMTGAEIPESADTVVMFEQAKETEDGFTVRKTFTSGDNIAVQGEESKKGDVILEKGALINPGTVAVLATFGYSEVEVFKKPEVGVLSTGSELLDVNEPLVRGKIRNSNSPMILAQLKRAGIEGKRYHLQSDDLETLYENINDMLEEVDIIITTGGVSVGDYDLLPKIYDKLGAEVLFNKVAMRPGSVTTVSRLGDKMLFGLSGNPSACYSGFELFVRPAIQAMMSSEKVYAPFIDAELDEDFTKPNPFTRFIRAEIHYVDGKVYAKPSGFNKSNAVTSIAKSNGVIVLPGGTRGFEKGDAVKVMMTDVTSGSDNFGVK
ncbi:gephyrin-like molybdotransferase Glp [Salinicoccus kekensis]|uniref:Molybdopterin molybdenumtransferase n=1 Tax=Salinicoccus kekensis TaxID=714307 RepID=A0A285URL4_9STAP|nr:gephyrin-like molybdotransferase Glp [Salinicoccus kekensis]SOC44469.1 molybdopterin molybdotransferase [Salinicoccus kekensis]